MPASSQGIAPNFSTFKLSVKNRSYPLETAVGNFTSLLKGRQIRGSRDIAEGTALLLRRVVESFEVGAVSKLLSSVQQVGESLVAAAPKELVVGNIVRRVLGLIREEAEEDRDTVTHDENVVTPHGEITNPALPRKASNKRNLGPDSGATGQDRGSTSIATGRTVFSLLSQSITNSLVSSGMSQTQSHAQSQPTNFPDLSKLDATHDLRAEIVEGILEILEELRQADEQIAGFALEHVHSNELILIQSSSETVRKFLLKAASKRKFTVICVESYPNHHKATHALVTAENSSTSDEKGAVHFQRSLTSAGASVILIPDSAVYAVMSRVNKVILDSHAVFANGGLISDAGAKQIAKAAHMHRTPVIFLSGIYKFSPVHPFNADAFMEDGDPISVVPYEEGELMGQIRVENPLLDYVNPELIDLYVTNLGGHAPSYTYRIIADHYRSEDIDLGGLEPYQ